MSSPKRTTQDNADIYDGFVDTLKTIVNEGETTVDKEGNVVKRSPSPATLNVIRQFLKDQNIQATPAHKGLKELADKTTKYPFRPDELDGEQEQAVH